MRTAAAAWAHTARPRAFLPDEARLWGRLAWLFINCARRQNSAVWKSYSSLLISTKHKKTHMTSAKETFTEKKKKKESHQTKGGKGKLLFCDATERQCTKWMRHMELNTCHLEKHSLRVIHNKASHFFVCVLRTQEAASAINKRPQLKNRLQPLVCWGMTVEFH